MADKRDRPLDERRRRFCENIVNNMRHKEAAIAAGYSPATADQIAARVLVQPAVKAHIKQLRDERDAAIGVDDEKKLKDHYASSLDLMRDIYNNPKLPFSVRVEAAKQALPYEHGKVGPKGKKQQQQEDAAAAAGGGKPSKFGVPSRPKLRAVS